MALLSDSKKRKQIREEFYKQVAEGGVSIPEAVKTLRKILKYNQEDFAQKMGISLSTLRRIEQGHENYTLNSLMTILRKFHLEVKITK